MVEDKFIILKNFFGRQVVEPFSGARYFGEPFKVPNADHFSIAKPEDKNAIQHRLLCRFILENAFSRAADEQKPSPLVKNSPLGLTMTRLYAIDEQGFDSAMERFGPNWRETEIKWPKASDRLLTIIQDALEAGADEEYFIKHAPNAITNALKRRNNVQKQLLKLIYRSSEFDREVLKIAVKNYLLLANWEIHRGLTYLSSWQGLKQLGLEVPTSVIPFQAISISPSAFEDALSRLFGEASEIYSGRLNYIGDYAVYDERGSYMYLYASKHILWKANVRIDDKREICTWFIPQIELQVQDSKLPNKYIGDWKFSVIKSSKGQEIGSTGD